MQVLSKRLQAVAGLVDETAHIIADIGCDHAYIAIYLCEQSAKRKVIAMDVHEGPLLRAKDNIKKSGLSNRIDCRLSDGLLGLATKEADTIIMAGMGGELMIRLLCAPSAFWDSDVDFDCTLILQPQSHVSEVRRLARGVGEIISEDMILEGNQFYPMMKVLCHKRPHPSYGDYDMPETVSEELADAFGPLLLKDKHPILHLFLEKEEARLAQLLDSVADNHRLETLKKDYVLVQSALEIYDEH